MRYFSLILCWIGFTFLPAGAAQAGTYTFSFTSDVQGTWTCQGGRDQDAPAGSVVINAEIRGAAPPADARVQVQGPGLRPPTPRDLSLSAGRGSLTIAEADVIPGQGLIVQATLSGQTPSCLEFTPVPINGGQDSQGPTEQERFDGDALVWWAANAKTKLADLRRNMGLQDRTVLLPHLPSGAAAPRTFESAPETALLQVVVIVPTGAGVARSYDVEVKSCPDRDPFRIQGDIATVSGLQANEFALILAGVPFQCGQGTATYSVRPVARGAQAKDGTLRLRPVYRLATTFAYGFDFARTDSFSVENQKVVRTVDEIGPGLRAGFTWFPWGVDFEDMRWYNYFLNPVAVFDPKAPSENFILGTTITPFGGISLLVGASVHKVTRLRGINVGDDFTGDGDIPTIEDWSEDGIGWYVGLALDEHLFGKLKNVFKTGS